MKKICEVFYPKKRNVNYFITGGCGFIGSYFVDRLALKGNVVIYDDLSSGKKEYIAGHLKKDNVKFIKADLLDFETLKKAIRNADIVFHLAANPDIRCGIKSPEVDFKQGVVATYNLLNAMRLNKVKKIVFSSSSTVYGEPTVRPTPEDYGPLVPISIYGASKLANEGFISAYCHMFDMQSWIFRFANIAGKRATHGILVDFLDKLEKNPHYLEVLGDGNQRKSYVLVDDCIEAMLFAIKKANDSVNIFNLGTYDDIEISKIAHIVVAKLGLKNVRFKYTDERRGWKGDVPFMLLDTKKINRLGWQARYNSQQAIERALDDLIEERSCSHGYIKK